MPTCYSNGRDDGGNPCGSSFAGGTVIGGTIYSNAPGIGDLFKNDSTAPNQGAPPSCFGGGGGCGCKEATPTVAGGAASAAQERLNNLVGNILNPLFRARRYGMSSYQASAEAPDFLFAAEARAYKTKKSGFFGIRALNSPGLPNAAPATLESPSVVQSTPATLFKGE